MKLRPVNASDAPAPKGRYAQAMEVTGAARLVFVSGQIPVGVDERVPADFDSQARLAWRHLAAQLAAADMGIGNLVKVTTFLASRDHALAYRAIRQEFLREHTPALTVIIADIFDASWLIEIEAVAAG